jgi:hypothetical protein
MAAIMVHSELTREQKVWCAALMIERTLVGSSHDAVSMQK